MWPHYPQNNNATWTLIGALKKNKLLQFSPEIHRLFPSLSFPGTPLLDPHPLDFAATEAASLHSLSALLLPA